jgi:hypothetical protein
MLTFKTMQVKKKNWNSSKLEKIQDTILVYKLLNHYNVMRYL